MAKPRAILFGRMGIPAELEEEFNTWYNEEYLPSRVQRVPGFLAGRRYRALEGGPKYATLYELASVDVLHSPEYRAIHEEERRRPTPHYQRLRHQFTDFRRAVYEEITPQPADYRPPATARVLLMAALVPPPEHEEEFNDWYNTEHLPALSSVAGFLSARRFCLVEGEGPKYLALYDVADYDVLKGEEYLTKRESPWADRIRRIVVSRERAVYERIFPPAS